MNIYKKYKEIIVKIIKKNSKEIGLDNIKNLDNIIVETPPSNFNFDLSCNVSLILAKINNTNPKILAANIKKILLKKSDAFQTIEIAGPGFLNISFNEEILKEIVLDIFKNKKNYGASDEKNKYNIEFVSANPTGPMHVGHCRGAIFGDVLSNLLKFNGNDVTKEYYINDYGNQIKNFTKSVFLRIREKKYNEKFVNDKDLYPGEYIKEISNFIIEKHKDLKFESFKDSYEILSDESLKFSMKLIKSDLEKLGIRHDSFISEKNIIRKDLVNKAIKVLKDNNVVEEGFLPPPKGENNKNWKKIKKLIFKSSIYGDDTDRSLQKDDGSWTYFANDVAYHFDKISRNYNKLINILGADHTGYIKRITAAVTALSKNKVELNCKVTQLVKLFKNGKPFKMSKRAGDFISVNDLLQEVDKDAIRFMMLNRSNDVELDFDFSKILEKNKDNPVFYVQYCYARICSLSRTLKTNLNEEIIFEENNFNINKYEKKLLRKIFDWPKIIENSSKKYEPHRIPFYLYELATIFHSYWSEGNKDEKYKFIDNDKIKNLNTLAIIKIVAIVIENGMKILGVSLPNKM